jgi:hypothetical protein
MPPIFHPPIDEQDHFATPLNAGERRIRDLLAATLDERWHVFVQPHLLNLQPDFVVAAPHFGVTVIEVKDWRNEGHRVRSGDLQVRDTHGEWHFTSQDPLAQVSVYKTSIATRYLMMPESPTSVYGYVHGVVAMPQWPSDEASSLLRSSSSLQGDKNKWLSVSGIEVFTDPEAFDSLVQGRGRERPIDEQLFNRFLKRMTESEAVSERRLPLKLSRDALDVSRNPNNAIIRRVKGPAGSGKSVGIAARAAVLAKEGKTVLLLSFNITLAHYLEALVSRHSREINANRKLVNCVHFHGFLSDVTKRFAKLDTRRFPSSFPPDSDEVTHEMLLSLEAIYATRDKDLPRYDAILIDEGQDFHPSWWNLLRLWVRKSDLSEMLLVCDQAQDIYERRSWIDEGPMRNLGFRAPWTQLKGSYRLPPDLIPIVCDFAGEFLPETVDLPDVPLVHQKIAFSPTVRKWTNATNLRNKDVANVLTREVQKMLESDGGPHEADIIVLVQEHLLGLEVTKALQASGISCEHIFTVRDNMERRNRKASFYPGANRLKASTIHSFKGWESRGIVFVLDGGGSDEQSARLAYIAMTRLKGEPGNRTSFITILNRVPFFSSFSTKFEREVSTEEVPQLRGQLGLDLETGPK